MKKENLVAFRVSMYDCADPNQLYNEIAPSNCISKKWIPQTMGEQIWMWFEFANEAAKQKYIDWINVCEVKSVKTWVGDDGNPFAYPANMFMHDDKFMTQEEINNWTK